MVSEVCTTCRNWFDVERVYDEFTILNGSLVVDGAQTNQYCRIAGSVFNDGVYKYPFSGLKDETFEGAVWLMAPPKDFLALVDDISAWEVANQDQAKLSLSIRKLWRVLVFKATGVRLEAGVRKQIKQVAQDMLIDAFKQPFAMVTPSRVSDNEGGWTTTWTDGREFEAALVLSSSLDARVAEHAGLTGVYTLTTDLDVELSFHDVVKTGTKTFRVTKVNDSPPSVASFSFNQYQVEEWGTA